MSDSTGFVHMAGGTFLMGMGCDEGKKWQKMFWKSIGTERINCIMG
jgi:hypothetical protein